MRPLTNEIAKPALPILGIPTVWYSAFVLAKEMGVKEIAVNCGHESATLKNVLKDSELLSYLGISFKISDESSQILGSGGALWKLKDWIGNDTLVVINGDSICIPDIKKMADFHDTSSSALTMHLRGFSSANTFSDEKYTDVELGLDEKIKKIGQKNSNGVMFSGIYILDGAQVNRLPSGVSDLKEKLILPLLQEQRLFGFKQDVAWFDIGSPISYAQTQFRLISAYPQFREMIEIKMREYDKGVWTPKIWQTTQLALSAPCIVTGEKKDWENTYRKLGPEFIGIEPPIPGMISKGNHEIVMGTNVLKI